MRLTARTVMLGLRTPFATGYGTVSERELVLVGLQAEDGVSGWGEAAPLAAYDGVSIADVREALHACEPVLAQYPGHAPIADVLARCEEATVLGPALAAIDLALWDLAGRRAGLPVHRLLGVDAPRVAIAVNATLAGADRSSAALAAAQARADGYDAIKVKVGLGDDVARLSAIRAFAGPQMAIRIDANGAWTLEQAAATLRALEPVGIELCEEPVHGLDEIRALSGQTEIPLALDETAADPLALDAPAAATLVCLKISRCGGISGTLAAAERARAAGYDVYLASTLDGPLGIAAALHAAAAIGPTRACGLATLAGFADRDDPFAPRAGAIDVPGAPGLGGDRLRDWYPA